MQLTYPGPGMQCDCTLMTLGDSRSRSVAPGRMASVAASERLLSRQSSRMPPSLMSRQPSTQTELQHEQAPTDMPPPAGPASRSFGSDISGQRVQKPSPPPPRASLDPNSLFLPSEADEDERKWGERDYEEEEDTLGWNANADAVSSSFLLTRQVALLIMVCRIISPKVSTTCVRIRKFPREQTLDQSSAYPQRKRLET